MKTVSKKLGAIVLALAMCFSLCCTALVSAADDYTITVDNSVPTKEYNAYKIFDATYSGDLVAYTITDAQGSWYELIAASNLFDLTPTSTDASGVSTYTVTVKDSTTDEAIITYLSACTPPDGASAAATGTGNGGSITLNVGAPGYYFVTTETGSIVSITTAAPTATIIDKNTTPGDLEKDMKVVDPDGDDHTDSQAIGEDIEFVVTADVPLYDGTYLVTDYQFTDTLTQGLYIELAQDEIDWTKSNADEHTYYATAALIDKWVTIGSANDEEVSLKLSDSSLVGSYYMLLTGVEETDSGYTANGFVLYYETFDSSSVTGDEQTAADINTGAYPSDATIEIDYTAHVNEIAEYDNENDIYMLYHRTPFDSPKPLEPEYGGEFEDYDDVYVAEIDVLKVDAANETKVLPGATFQLVGDNLYDVVINTTITYTPLESLEEYQKELAAGTTLYFKLDDGFYTTVNPYLLADDDPSLNNYVVTPNAPEGYPYAAYTQTVSEETQVVPSGDTHTVTGMTDENGKVTFRGLRSGTYTLTEIVAPDGYNLLPDPITITIQFVTDTEKATGHFVISAVNSEGTPVGEFTQDTGTFTLTIDNNAGSELPGTGGIGTTIFYIIGGVLVVGAVVVLVTRRRMTREG